MKNKYLVIGDIHSNFIELQELLLEVGLDISDPNNIRILDSYDGRLIVSVGDLHDRGLYPIQVLKTFLKIKELGLGLSIRGNHEKKLLSYLSGKDPKLNHGLAKTVEAVEREGEEFMEAVRSYLEATLYIYEDEELLVVHAAHDPTASEKRNKALNLFGQVVGQGDDGYPIRSNKWAEYYPGPHKIVVHGHVALNSAMPLLTNSKFGAKVYNIDLKCYEDGWLCGLFLPEEKIFRVKAKHNYREILNSKD